MASADSRNIEAPQPHGRPSFFSAMATMSPVLTPPAKQSQTAQTLSSEPAPRSADVAKLDRRNPLSIEVGQKQTPATVKQKVKGHGILIVGTGATARDVRNYLTSLRHTRYDFRGFAGTSRQIFQTRATDAERISNAQDVIALARSRFVDEVIFTERPSSELEADLLSEAAPHSINVRFIPDVSETLRAPQTIRYIGDLPTILMHKPAPRTVEKFVKRTLDVLFSSVGLAVLGPLMLLIAIAVRLDSAGPIFYASPRIGKKGRVIYCHKFRTMVSNAAALLSSVAHLNDRDGVFFKIKKDPRITRIGAVLRKYSLDELPQLWNVLRGDMSLVGPRPCIPTDVSHYKTPHYIRHDVLPGLTGLWQVEARNDPSFERYIQLDNKYVDEWSIWLDLKLIARTFRVVLLGTGV
jgi:exopolysaccharide biosynthesis polyprenyl glycosylphosphotransferase